MVAVEILGQALTLVQRGALNVLYENAALEARASGQKSQSKAKKLAKGVIIAIVVIVVVFLIFCGLLIYCCCFRKKAKKPKEEELGLQPAVNGPGSAPPMPMGPPAGQAPGPYYAPPPTGAPPGGEAQGYYGGK